MWWIKDGCKFFLTSIIESWSLLPSFWICSDLATFNRYKVAEVMLWQFIVLSHKKVCKLPLMHSWVDLSCHIRSLDTQEEKPHEEEIFWDYREGKLSRASQYLQETSRWLQSQLKYDSKDSEPQDRPEELPNWNQSTQNCVR